MREETLELSNIELFVDDNQTRTFALSIPIAMFGCPDLPRNSFFCFSNENQPIRGEELFYVESIGRHEASMPRMAPKFSFHDDLLILVLHTCAATTVCSASEHAESTGHMERKIFTGLIHRGFGLLKHSTLLVGITE